MTEKEQIFAYKELRNNGQVFVVDTYEDADRIIEALEKQIPKKPTDVQKPVVCWGICPTCKGLPEELGRPQRVFQSNNYCSNCGQRIDFGKE